MAELYVTQGWNFSGNGDSMRGQWISNWLARLETLGRLRLGGRFASLPDYAGATVEAGGEN